MTQREDTELFKAYCGNWGAAARRFVKGFGDGEYDPLDLGTALTRAATARTAVQLGIPAYRVFLSLIRTKKGLDRLNARRARAENNGNARRDGRARGERN
jgi:hypothetical protein